MNASASPLILREPPLREDLLPASIPWLWITAGGILLAIVLIVAIIRLNRRKPVGPMAARRAALAHALREIEDASSLAPRMAAIQVSLAIRRYLSTAAGDPSLYETHEEFLARHPSLTHWPAETIDSLVATLKQIAEIKYRPQTESLNPTDLADRSRSLLLTLDGQSAA